MTEPEGRHATLVVSASVAGTPISALVVEVTAGDIRTALAFHINLDPVTQMASGAVTVPAGPDRVFTVRGFDTDGTEIHRGSATVSVQPGFNPRLSITLLPRPGEVPVVVTLASITVTVTPAAAELLPGETVQLSAAVADAAGNPVAARVQWATLSQAVATVDTTGLVTAVAAGVAQIVALYGGISGLSRVTVSAVAVAPASIAVNDGDNQTASVGEPVPIPPSVVVKDASGLPVPGVTVEFAVASGGGTVQGATQLTDALGIARVGSWTLGTAEGSNTLTATASGSSIAGNPVTFAATATATRQWTGAVSTDWSTPDNWSPAGVPSALNDVVIGDAANQPTLTANAAAKTLALGGATARLTIGGQVLSVGYLVVYSDGLLIMTNPADRVIVSGSAGFQGGNQTGFLTAGELRVAGDFTQQTQTDPRSFLASGTHRVVLNGTSGLQRVDFCCSAGASAFQDLDISTSVGMNIQFDANGVYVRGTFTSKPGSGPAPVLWGLGRSLQAARFQIDQLVVDRASLTLNEGNTPLEQLFDNVTFRDDAANPYYPTHTQLTLVMPGGTTARSLTFNNLGFVPLTSGNTGRYLNVTATTGSLIINLPGANQAVGDSGPAFTVTFGAVTVNWI